MNNGYGQSRKENVLLLKKMCQMQLKSTAAYKTGGDPQVLEKILKASKPAGCARFQKKPHLMLLNFDTDII